MTVGNFSEVIGTDGFDSIRGEDLSVVYALGDQDHLNSSLSPLKENPTTILVGGSGDNNYIVWKDSTTFILENSDSPNILWTNIATNSGISLSDDDSFVAEIDDRHLYLGNTATGQYVIVVDWQLPENQIETFALSEGNLSYAEFSLTFRSSSNYRGNLTWAELAAIEEIDLDRLGLSPEAIADDFEAINARSLELSFIASNPLSAYINEDLLDRNNDDLLGDFLAGDADDNVLEGSVGNDAIFGGAGDDRIFSSSGNDVLGGGVEGEDLDSLYSVGGRDSLLGGFDNDTYLISLNAGGGSEIRDRIDLNDTDILFITAENTDIDSLLNADADDYLELVTDPETFGDSAIEISLPEAGIVGMEKSGKNLIIDLNRDGIAEAQNDLTIIDFFDREGELGKGSISQINQIIDPQAIADFF